MAGIDKIYVTYNQYIWFHKWMEEIKTSQKTLISKYLYQYDQLSLHMLKQEKRKFALSNFPEKIDMWLLENCRLKFIKKRIRQQYGINKET